MSLKVRYWSGGAVLEWLCCVGEVVLCWSGGVMLEWSGGVVDVS